MNLFEKIKSKIFPTNTISNALIVFNKDTHIGGQIRFKKCTIYTSEAPEATALLTKAKIHSQCTFIHKSKQDGYYSLKQKSVLICHGED
jgi:hypothetical protein